MDGEARIFERRIRSEFGEPRLVVRWNRDIERYEVGYRNEKCASDYVEWFLVVQEPNTGTFRPLDQRTIDRLRCMDKTVIPVPTPEEYRRMKLDAKEAEKRKRVEEKAYRLKHEAKFFGGRFWNPNLAQQAG